MSAIEEAVIEKIRQRAEAGLKKYGVTMERGDLSLRDWLIHAQQEAMDHCVYLERAIRDLDAAKAKAEPPKAVDLSKCRRGDRLRRRDGCIVMYYGVHNLNPNVSVAGAWNYEKNGKACGFGDIDIGEDIIEVIGQ